MARQSLIMQQNFNADELAEEKEIFTEDDSDSEWFDSEDEDDSDSEWFEDDSDSEWFDSDDFNIPESENDF